MSSCDRPSDERWGLQVLGETLRVVVGRDETDPYRPDVALVGNVKDPGVWERGRLLAAAPDLLEALRALAEGHEDGGFFEPNAELMAQVRAAIAKAEGRS